VNEPLHEVTIRVLRDEEEIQRQEFPADYCVDHRQYIEQLPEEELDEKRLELRANIRFSPFRVDEPCLIKVRIDTEQGEMRGGALEIEQVAGEQDS